MPRPIRPWITEENLDSYVYVLPNRYVSQDNEDRSAVFHARTGRHVEAVSSEDVAEFLGRHLGHTVVTYDAVELHKTCLGLLDSSCKRLIWDFSKNYRLWDVALIERRTEYAHTRFANQIQDRTGLEALITKRINLEAIPQDAEGLLLSLRDAFIEQVSWAFDNLPLFQTYRIDVPEPVSVDEYCDCLDAARQQVFSPVRLPSPSRRYRVASIARHAPFRRRDQALTGKYGPFGTGLDTQAAILTEAMNSHQSTPMPVLTETATYYAQSVFDNSHDRFGHPSLSDCFQWDDIDGRKRILRQPDGTVGLVEEPWAKRLHTFQQERQAYITAPHTYPVDRHSEVSTHADDWLDFRFLNPAIDDWLELEAAASIFRTEDHKTLFEYESFPALRSVPAEILPQRMDGPALQAAPDHAFLTLRWQNSLTHTLTCSLFSSYLLHRRYEFEEDQYDIFEPIFSQSSLGFGDPSSEYISILLRAGQSPEELWLAEHLKTFSEETRQQIYEETLTSFRLLENADVYRRRLADLECDFSTHWRELLYRAVLVATFSPFMTSHDMPLKPIPNPGMVARKNIKANEWHAKHPRFFRSPDPDEIMIETVAAHFESKAETAYEEVATPILKKQSRHFGWSFINKLHRDNYDYFISTDRLGSFATIRNATAQYGKGQVIADLQRTNAVSSGGRIGRPIRYYEWIDADSRLLLADIITNAAFDLLAAGNDVVLVTPDQVVLHVPLTDIEAQAESAKTTMQDAIASTLATAFPSDHPPVDMVNYFVNDQIICSVNTIWPRPNAASQDEGVNEEQEILSDEVIEYSAVSSSGETSVLRKAVLPTNKRFRKRKNSKPPKESS